MNAERCDHLIHGYLDGSLSDGERTEFEDLLLTSAQARRRFWELAEVHGLAGEAARIAWGEPEPIRAAPPAERALAARGLSRSAWRWAALGLTVAAAAAVVSMGINLLVRPAPVAVPAGPVTWIATLVGQHACEWADGAARLTGQRLAAGTLRLRRGTAVVCFDAGARMVVAGPAEFALESPGSARLMAGRVSVRAPEEAMGFRLYTPDGAAVDLGTEFVVSVNGALGTECEVIEGEVEWHSPDQRARLTRLTTGEARRFHSGRIETIAARGAEALPKLAPQAPTGSGQLLAYEPFDYPGGDLPAETLAGGFGWRSPWRGRYIQGDEFDQDPRIRIVPGGGLAFPGLAASAGGGLVFHEPRMWRLRQLQTPVDFGRDGVHYFSWLLRRQPDDPPSNHPRARVALDLRSSTDYWRHWVGFAISQKNQLLVVADGNNRVADLPMPRGGTLLAIGKIATSRLGPDQLFFKVYQEGDSLDTEDPARWSLVGPELDFDLVADLLIPGILGGGAWTLDELRHGTSWSAVLPPPSAK